MGAADEHFAAVKAKNAAALAKAEQEARESGKEPFSREPLAAIYSEATLGRREESLRLMYYVSHPEIRSMTEFVALLRKMEQYE
ncbi:MAG: hypothetical protein HOV81_03145 [Kofleriaceae bacterium]|nr:hypothetical protein [Kofleriaceae bacterium]